jgi:hypothetical protein
MLAVTRGIHTGVLYQEILFSQVWYLGTTTFSTATLSIMAFSITTLCITFKSSWHSAYKHSIQIAIMVNAILPECHFYWVSQKEDYAECHYVDCRYAECCGAWVRPKPRQVDHHRGPHFGLIADVRLGWKALPSSVFQHSRSWVSKPIKTYLFLFFVKTLTRASLFVPGNGLVSQILDLSEQSYHVTAEQRALKNVINCLNTNIYSYLETTGGQSSNLYLNAVHFFNNGVN